MGGNLEKWDPKKEAMKKEIGGNQEKWGPKKKALRREIGVNLESRGLRKLGLKREIGGNQEKKGHKKDLKRIRDNQDIIKIKINLQGQDNIRTQINYAPGLKRKEK